MSHPTIDGPGTWTVAGAPVVSVFLRLAVAAGFLSAVADRFGLWGPVGSPGVAWGDFSHFLDYTATLNPWAPELLIPWLGWIATGAEIAIGALLLAGFQTRKAGFAGGALLVLFGLGMTVGTGPKSALDASVFAAAGASFALAVLGPGPLSLDAAWSRDSPAGDR